MTITAASPSTFINTQLTPLVISGNDKSKPMQIRLYRKEYVHGSVSSEDHLKKPNPARETVSLRYETNNLSIVHICKPFHLTVL
jgi:hypothetical protein